MVNIDRWKDAVLVGILFTSVIVLVSLLVHAETLALAASVMLTVLALVNLML